MSLLRRRNVFIYKTSGIPLLFAATVATTSKFTYLSPSTFCRAAPWDSFWGVLAASAAVGQLGEFDTWSYSFTGVSPTQPTLSGRGGPAGVPIRGKGGREGAAGGAAGRRDNALNERQNWPREGEGGCSVTSVICPQLQQRGGDHSGEEGKKRLP